MKIELKKDRINQSIINNCLKNKNFKEIKKRDNLISILSVNSIVKYSNDKRLNDDYKEAYAKILEINKISSRTFLIRIMTGAGRGREIHSDGSFFKYYWSNTNRNNANLEN